MQTNRKGIYQEYDAQGNVRTDERWQAQTLANGSLYVENETVRMRPSPEPRSDSVTCILDEQLRLIDFSIHGMLGQRESRICVVGAERTEATLCWRHRGEVHERRVVWNERVEIDYASALLTMVTILRTGLSPGSTEQRPLWRLDPLTFEPHAAVLTLICHGPETHATTFGARRLHRCSRIIAGAVDRIWCDDEGVVFEMQLAAGGGFRLTALNVD